MFFTFLKNILKNHRKMFASFFYIAFLNRNITNFKQKIEFLI